MYSFPRAARQQGESSAASSTTVQHQNDFPQSIAPSSTPDNNASKRKHSEVEVDVTVPSKKVPCEYGCKKLLSDRKTMTKHAKAVHIARVHACDKCGKRFKRKSHLKKHTRPGGRCTFKSWVPVPAQGSDVPSSGQPGPSRVLSSNDSSKSED